MGPRNGSTLETYRKAKRYIVMTGSVLPGSAQGLADLDVRSRTGSGTATSSTPSDIPSCKVQGVLALITGMRRVPSFAELTEKTVHDVTEYYRNFACLG